MLTRLFKDNLIYHVEPNAASAGTYTLAAGTSAVNSGVLDLNGVGPQSVAFLAIMGDNLDTGTFAMKIQGSNDNDAWTDCAGATTSFTAGASDTDHELLGVETNETNYRYYRVVITRGVANTALNGLLGFAVQPRGKPVTQGTGTGQFVQAPVVASA